MILLYTHNYTPQPCNIFSRPKRTCFGLTWGISYTSFSGVFNNPLNRPLDQCSTNSRKTPALYILCVAAKLGIKPEKDHTPPSLLGFHPILHYFDVRLMFNCFFSDNLMDMFFGLNPGEQRLKVICPKHIYLPLFWSSAILVFRRQCGTKKKHKKMKLEDSVDN